ncbi:hypothetical protein CONLIGDRAFT_687748 [Coniochaeta ligniaria NRRL 30616]|uniref:Uncharacterized protein n=1 Tax=Coniochaeta ligniaria NRRL 30616 TaxID=1408157 RepID=A0A1J7IM74_9PEZI|nr:hypothetical protein CONLIGDRAFT_687748 [Coniochaeta ligniaria NRRL 30616]
MPTLVPVLPALDVPVIAADGSLDPGTLNRATKGDCPSQRFMLGRLDLALAAVLPAVIAEDIISRAFVDKDTAAAQINERVERQIGARFNYVTPSGRASLRPE